MRAWTVIRGNTSQQEIPIKDKKGVLVTDLASATEIKFQVKEGRRNQESPLISKSKGDGIEVDQPSPGYLRITLVPSDSAGIRPSERYVMALQIKWVEDVESYETRLRINGELTDKFVVKAGII